MKNRYLCVDNKRFVEAVKSKFYDVPDMSHDFGALIIGHFYSYENTILGLGCALGEEKRDVLDQCEWKNILLLTAAFDVAQDEGHPESQRIKQLLDIELQVREDEIRMRKEMSDEGIVL